MLFDICQLICTQVPSRNGVFFSAGFFQVYTHRFTFGSGKVDIVVAFVQIETFGKHRLVQRHIFIGKYQVGIYLFHELG